MCVNLVLTVRVRKLAEIVSALLFLANIGDAFKVPILQRPREEEIQAITLLKVRIHDFLEVILRPIDTGGRKQAQSFRRKIWSLPVPYCTFLSCTIPTLTYRETDLS